jgi:hypothetical protein
MTIGDKVKYTPSILTEDKIVERSTIIKLIRAGSFFNQDMAIIEGVDHWVPVCDLKLITQ